MPGLPGWAELCCPPRALARPCSSTPQTPTPCTAPSPSAWASTRRISSPKVSAASSFGEFGDFWKSFCCSSRLRVCFSGSFHSSTTPDQACQGLTPLTPHLPPLLYDLESDPAENYDLLAGQASPELLQVLRDITLQKVLLEQRLEFGESQIRKGRDPSLQPCCAPNCSPKPSCCRCSPH